LPLPLHCFFMHLLEITESFSAAHALRDYDGKCSTIHGHNWIVVFAFRAEGLDKNGMAVDYFALRNIVLDVIREFDHKNINEHEFFEQNNPSSENLTKYFFDRVKTTLTAGVTLESVRLSETQGFSVTYTE